MHTQQSQESNPQPQRCGNVLIKHKCTYSSILMQTATTLVMKVLSSPSTYIDLELFLWELSTSGVYWQSLSECDRVLLWMLTCCRSNSVSVIFCCWRSVISAKAPAALDLKYLNGHWHCFSFSYQNPEHFKHQSFVFRSLSERMDLLAVSKLKSRLCLNQWQIILRNIENLMDYTVHKKKEIVHSLNKIA